MLLRLELLRSCRAIVGGGVVRLLGGVLRLLDDIRVLLLGTLLWVFAYDSNLTIGRLLHVLRISVLWASLLVQTLLLTQRRVVDASFEMLHQVCFVSQISCLINRLPRSRNQTTLLSCSLLVISSILIRLQAVETLSTVSTISVTVLPIIA